MAIHLSNSSPRLLASGFNSTTNWRSLKHYAVITRDRQKNLSSDMIIRKPFDEPKSKLLEQITHPRPRSHQLYAIIVWLFSPQVCSWCG